MTVSVGAAIDHLVTAATIAVTGITVMNKPVLVVDCQAEEPVFAVLAIGITQPPPDGVGEIQVTRTWADIGDRHILEDYSIPCYIDVRVSGKSQKPVRDTAESIFNAFWAQILADMTLGGAVHGGQPVDIDDFRSTGSNVGTVADPGRRQLVTFGVHCLNLTR